MQGEPQQEPEGDGWDITEEETAILATAEQMVQSALDAQTGLGAFDLDPISQRALPAPLRVIHALLRMVHRLRARVQPRRVSDWQPIETAPRDSSRVLVYVPGIRMRSVREAWWRIPYDGAPTEKGWWCYDEDGTLLDAHFHDELGATHWMPLPGGPDTETEVSDVEEGGA